ncbi:hypothetical protein [Streptomyces sp. NPDC050416]
MAAVVASLDQPAQAAAPAAPDQPDEVSPDALNLIVPGLIERVEV